MFRMSEISEVLIINTLDACFSCGNVFVCDDLRRPYLCARELSLTLPHHEVTYWMLGTKASSSRQLGEVEEISSADLGNR